MKFKHVAEFMLRQFRFAKTQIAESNVNFCPLIRENEKLHIKLYFSRFRSHRRRCHGDAQSAGRESRRQREREGGSLLLLSPAPDSLTPPARTCRCVTNNTARARATIRGVSDATDSNEATRHRRRASRFGQRAQNFFPAPVFLRPARHQDQTRHFTRLLSTRPQDARNEVWVTPLSAYVVCWFSHRKRTTNNNCQCVFGCFFAAFPTPSSLHLSVASASSCECVRKKIFFSGLRPLVVAWRRTQPKGFLLSDKRGCGGSGGGGGQAATSHSLYHPSWLTLGPSMDAARDFESLQIKTKSIEQTLLPLVKQVGPETILYCHSVTFRAWNLFCWHVRQWHLYQRVISTSYYNLHVFKREVKQAELLREAAGGLGGVLEIFLIYRADTQRHCSFDLPELEQQWQCPRSLAFAQ